MSGYCPAGKCECERFRIAFAGDPLCEFPTNKHWDAISDSFEQCPWPSRQVGVEPQAEDAVGNMIERGMAYNRGLAEGIRRCREAVRKLTRKQGAFTEFEVDEDMLLAAIDAVNGE